MDMDTHLSTFPYPHLLYTFVPVATAGRVKHGNASYHFQNNKLVMRVDGGGKFEHGITDYGQDSLMTTTLDKEGYLKRFPLHTEDDFYHSESNTPRTVVYLIERRSLESGNSVILLMPIAVFTGVPRYPLPYKLGTMARDFLEKIDIDTDQFDWPHSGPATGAPVTFRSLFLGRVSHDDAYRANNWLQHAPLKKLEPLDANGFNFMKIQHGGQRYVSTSIDGCDTSSFIHASAFAAFESTLRTSKRVEIHLSQAGIRSYLEKIPAPELAIRGYAECKHVTAALLNEYFVARSINETHTVQVPYVYATGERSLIIDRNQTPANFTEAKKPLMLAYMACFIGPCHNDVKSHGNNLATVEQRVTSITNPVLKIPPFLMQCMKEFVEEISAHGKLHPKDIGEVYDSMPRPNQRAQLDKEDKFGPHQTASGNCFLKAECGGVGGSIKAPRNITNMATHTKRTYAAYMISFSEWLKTFPWYGFRNPTTIAAKVADICSRAKRGVTLTDFSRMDGRVSNVGRLLTQHLMLACFGEEYHDDLKDIMDDQYELNCYLGEVAFTTWFERGSGSHETSPFNTVENVFPKYYAHRLSGKSHEEAIAAINQNLVAAGDDGAEADAPLQYQQAAARAMGHLLTFDDKRMEIPRGGTGIQFLSRCFGPNVWNGDTNSCCTIRRQAAKFHMCRQLGTMKGGVKNITKAKINKMVEKCASVLLTDRNTPLMGDFAVRVDQLVKSTNFQASKSNVLEPANWFGQFEENVQFPNEDCDGWMLESLHDAIPGYDLGAFRDFLAKCTKLEQLLETPCYCEAAEAPKHTIHEYTSNGPGLELHMDRTPPQLNLTANEIDETQTREVTTSARKTARAARQTKRDHRAGNAKRRSRSRSPSVPRGRRNPGSSSSTI